LYVAFWVLEIVAIIAIALVLVLPVQDFALREFVDWREHPSSESLEKFIAKQQQERVMRFIIAVPLGVTAVIVAGTLKKYRQKLRTASK